MKRQLLPFILGFLVALVAAMSAAVVSAGRDAARLFPPTDSLHAHDLGSTEAAAPITPGSTRPGGIGVPAMLDATADQPAKAPEVVHTTAADRIDEPAAGRSLPATGGTDAAATTTAEPAPALSLTRDSTAAVYERRLARTFGAMSPRDAARVLEQMSDADVGTLLGYLNERQSAGILSSLPPTRAARLGEQVLRDHESN